MRASNSTNAFPRQSIMIASSRSLSQPKRQVFGVFVYCSSSSVYGVSNFPEVTEEHPLVPLTLYNKFKGMCEPLF